MARMVVVLPAPLGPRKPTTWPAGTLNERSSSAVSVPNVRRRPSSSKWSAHPVRLRRPLLCSAFGGCYDGRGRLAPFCRTKSLTA